MPSRLRETTTLGGNTEPRPPKRRPAKPTRARKKSCLVHAKRMFTESSKKKSPLVYARRTFSKSSVVSSTRHATFCENMVSRLNQTPTLGSGSRHRGWGWLGQGLQMHCVKWRLVYAKHTLSKTCTLQRASHLRETHISKIRCRLVYARRDFF